MPRNATRIHTFRPLASAASPAIITLLALLLAAATAAAQPRAGGANAAGAGSLDADKPHLFLEFGWAGRVDPDRWTPVRITIQGGAEPFSGAVVIEHPQDPTQTSTVTIPVTATPGRTTHTTAALSLPTRCEHITARLVDDRGRIVRQLFFSQTPSPQQHPMPDLVAGLEPLTAAVAPSRSGRGGDAAFADAAAASISLIEESLDGLGGLRSRLGAGSRRAVAPEALPMTWAAYDGVSVLAIDADAAAAADPRSIAAVREWVTGGGRLVVIAAAPGDAWRAWLPPSPNGSYVTLDEATRGPVPPDLAAAVLRAHARADQAEAEAEASRRSAGQSGAGPTGVYGPFRPSNRSRSSAPGPSDEPGQDEPAADEGEQSDDAPAARTPTESPIQPAVSAAQRMIRLTPHGRDAGWRLRWRPDAPAPGVAWVEPPGAAMPADAVGLLAEGPVGFGWVTLIGVEPRSAAATANDTATRAVWEDALSVSLAHRRALAEAAASSPWGGWYTWSRSSEARIRVLNELASAPGAGRGAFLVIVAAMIGLALLMGPVDAAVLRRLRARHRSWLTSLLWISLATLAAYMAPALSRSSIDTVARLSAVDVLVPAEGDALAWQTSITGVFAGRSMRAALTPVPPPGGGAPAAWWRGFSAIDHYGETPQRLGTAVQTMQSLPNLGSLEAAADEWGGWGGGRPLSTATAPGATAPPPIPGGNTMMPTALRTWTFRSFEDQARTAPPCTARIRSGESGPVVEVSGLPAGAAVAAAACRIGDQWHELAFPGRPDGGRPLAAPLGPALDAPPPAWSAPAIQPHDRWERRRPGASVNRNPAVALAMPGPDRRDLAADTLLSTRNWAAVYLHLENMPSDAALTPYPRRGGAAAGGVRTVVCRILTPAPTRRPAAPGDPR